MEAQKFSCLCIYHLFPHTFPCAKVQKTLPGLVPSNWFGGKPVGLRETPGGHIASARPHKLFKTCVPRVSECLYLLLSATDCSVLLCAARLLTHDSDRKCRRKTPRALKGRQTFFSGVDSLFPSLFLGTYSCMTISLIFPCSRAPPLSTLYARPKVLAIFYLLPAPRDFWCLLGYSLSPVMRLYIFAVRKKCLADTKAANITTKVFTFASAAFMVVVHNNIQ